MISRNLLASRMALLGVAQSKSCSVEMTADLSCTAEGRLNVALIDKARARNSVLCPLCTKIQLGHINHQGV